MKNRMPAMPLVFLTFLALLTGCGGQKDGGTETPAVDLNSLYAAMAEACGWEESDMTALEGELLESYYPGLSELSARQLVAMVPAMSSDVNEIVLFQGETEADAEAAAAVFQNRIDTQAGGGAWYADSLAAWERAAVLRQGTYAALIASGAYQESLEAQFQGAFS